MADEASASFLSACVRADEMPFALDQMAALAGGDGAVLVYSRNTLPINATASANILEPIQAYVRGDRPPDPRIVKVNPTLEEDFRLDQDDFTLRQIAQDPFYQEFLRPWGFGWHACALLAEFPGGDVVHLSIKRQLDRGPFSVEDVAPLAAQLPMLRSAVKFTQILGQPAPPDFAPHLGERERCVIGFNALGQPFEISRSARAGRILAARDGALICDNPKDQAAVDAAVERACRLSEPAALILTGIDGLRWSFRMRPWKGSPLGPHGPTAFVAVVSALDYLENPSPEWLDLARSLFGLSAAEARIAALIGQGLPVSLVAKRLALSPGTVRNQLNAVFAKTGVRRQVELSVLMSRI